MRLHSTLLILYLLHVAADAAPSNCEKSLVKEQNSNDKVFDGGVGKELTCNNDKRIVIEGQSNQYVKLKCDAKEWIKNDGSPFDPIKKANEELKFECKAKAATCDASYIDGPNGKYQFSATQELTCKGTDIEIMVGGKPYDKLKCEASGWKEGANPITPVKKADEDLNFKCEKKPCHKLYIKKSNPNADDYDYDFSVKELTCQNNKAIEIAESPGTQYEKLKCDIVNGWMNEGTQIRKPKAYITIKCVPKSPPPSTKCAQTQIKGGPNFSQDATYTSKILKCIDAKNEIEYEDGKLYKELKCDETKGWIHGANEVKLKESDKEITVKCAAKACHKSLISGFDDLKMTYDASHSLKCSDNTEVLEFTKDAKTKIYDVLTCSPAANWNGDNIDTQTLATDSVVVSCVKKACHLDLIADSPDLVKTTPKELSCGAGKKLKIDDKEFDKVTCDDVAMNWVAADGGIVKTATEKFAATCIQPATDKCAVQAVTGIVHDIAAKTLTCDPNVPAEIGHSGLPVPEDCEGLILTCDEVNGWKKGDQAITGAGADTPLVVTYSKYCEVTGADVDYKISEDRKYYAVTCKAGTNEVNGVFYSDTAGAAAKLVKVMTCSKADGWTADTVPTGKPSNAPLTLECRKGCDNIQKPNSDATQWEVGLTDSVEPDPSKLNRKEVGYRWFECSNNKLSLAGDVSIQKNAIRLNEKFVHSHLRCSIDKGYTDFAGKSLVEDAYAQVKIDCVDSPCKRFGSPPTCKALEGSTPKGFICLDSAFTETDDPNQLNCGTKLHQLYDNEEKQILDDYSPDKPLTCKEGVSKKESPYGIWYKYGDAQETKIANVDKMVCLRMKCNACTKLATFPDTFTEGTHDKCATVTCENNLWMIKKEGATAEEEYAGEVTCTTFDERTSDRPRWVSRWIIDVDWNPTKIAEGRCFAGPLTNCMESAKLETKCNSAWPGCTELTLSNDNLVTCPDGKMMYYKHKGVEDWKQFEEGAKSIKCDATKGVWTITPGEKALNRGDTVICGDSSNPITTTLAPTTLGPDPCDICKQGLKKCDTCEGEIDFKIDTETEKCTATMEGSVDGVLTCDASEKVWKDTNGKAVGQFTAKKKEEDANMGLIIGGAIGGAVVLFVVLFVIFKLVISRRKPKEDDKDEETKRRMLEEGKKRKKKRGDNDEILDEVSVDAPSELKL